MSNPIKDKVTLVISKTNPQGRESWLCWIEGDEDKGSLLISTVPCGVKWAFSQGSPVTHWKFHGEAAVMSAEAIRYSAYQIEREKCHN